MAEQLITATDFFSRPATEPLVSAALRQALAVVKSGPPALLDVVCQPRSLEERATLRQSAPCPEA